MHNQNFNSKQTSRAGEQHRINADRFFHVMSQGWYVHTREGIRGPFIEKHRAEVFIRELARKPDSNPDPSSAWRL